MDGAHRCEMGETLGMETRDAIYRGSFWLAVALTVAATGVGIYESIVIQGRPPGLEILYRDYLVDLIDEGKTDDDVYERALSEMQMVVDIDLTQRVIMLGSIADYAEITGDREVEIEALRELAAHNEIGEPKRYNNLATALIDSWSETHDANLVNESIKYSSLAINMFKALPAPEKLEFAKSHCNLGAAYVLLRDHRNAVVHFQEALKLDPTLIQAQQGLAYLMQGQPPQ